MSRNETNDDLALADVTLLRRKPNVEPHKTWRDVAMPLFRQRRIASLIFCGVLGGALLSALLMPRKYQAEMKIFVNRDRAEAVVTPDMSTAVAPVPSVTQEDMNSEVELLTSTDLLDSVVLTCGLDGRHTSWWTRLTARLADESNSPAARVAESEQLLRNALTVEPLQKTTIIRVAYLSHDPKLAARVLQTVAKLYQEKHAAVHRPSGTLAFFEQQTARYQNELATAEGRRIAFDEQEGVIAPAAQQQLALEQLSKFQAELQQNQSDAYAASARAKALRAEETSAPRRQTTEMRQAGNAQLLAELRSTLLSLELRRTDMLVKYAPSYPPVKDVETQIAQTQKAIQSAEHSPVSEVTTDRVPAQDWIATELAKSEADRAQFAAEATALRGIVRQYQNVAQNLNQIGDTQADLTRTVQTAQDNYLLYLRKREEARISDALDERRIVNVSMAEAPTVPALPVSHTGWLLLGGLFAAGITSVGAAYAADAMDSSFRTPDELHRYLDLKVLAAIPRSRSLDA
jgi:uncharacterized protein involved in exopolysaccharide biosynthesis